MAAIEMAQSGNKFIVFYAGGDFLGSLSSVENHGRDPLASHVAFFNQA